MSNVKKIMERESALKVIDEIKNKICDVDLDELCDDKVEVVADNNGDKLKEKVYNDTIKAVMCGLVYWDETENCMAQIFIHPLESNQQTAEKIYYKNELNLGDAKKMNATNEAELTLKSLSNITGKSEQLLEKIKGKDLNIALGCLSFFDR